MHILFYEQAVYERGTKTEKGLLDKEKYNSCFYGEARDNV